MMSADAFVNHSSKELLVQRWHFSLLHAHPPDGQRHPSSLWVLQLCQHASSSVIFTGLSSWPQLHRRLLSLLDWSSHSAELNSLANFKQFTCCQFQTIL